MTATGNLAPSPFRAERLLVFFAFAPLVLGAADAIPEVDPSQYAEVGRRMFESGDWAHLKDNDGPFLNKPPATFWMMSGAFQAFGETSFAVRFPSLLMAAAVLAATVRLGQLLGSLRVGWIAAAMLGASPALQLMVADPKVDMVLTGFTVLTVLALLEARRRPWMVWLAWVSAGLGVLTKGPIGLVLPSLAVLPEALRRVWGRSDEPGGFGWRLWAFRPLSGLVLLGGVIAPWFVENAKEYGDKGPKFFLWQQGPGRLFGHQFQNGTTPLFFFHTALWAFLPFVQLLLVELWHRFVQWRRAGWRLPPDENRVLIWWLFLPLLIISAARYKLPQYLYWLAPPAALIAAQGLERIIETHAAKSEQALHAFGKILGLLVLAAVGAFLQVCFPQGIAATALWFAVAALIVLGSWAVSTRASAGASLAIVLVAATSAFNVVYQGHLHRALLEFQPERDWGERVRAEDPTGRVLPFFRADTTNAAAFYARREAVGMSLEELVRVVNRGDARVAVVSADALAELRHAPLVVTPLEQRSSFPTSRPTGKFLLARTRASVTRSLMLVRLAKSE